MTVAYNHKGKNTTTHGLNFDLDAELSKHAWFPNLTVVEAEELLAGKSAYTYLTRPYEVGRGFAISFVDSSGAVHHDHFTLINPKYGIFRNCMPHHVGKLEKVLRDMMKCSFSEGQPLK